MPGLTLDEIARMIDGRVAGDPARRVTAAAPPDAAGEADITFVFGDRAGADFLASKAGAAVVPKGFEAPGRDVVQADNPQGAMPAVLSALYPEARPAPGVHPTALVDPTARLGAGVHVGPGAIVEAGAVLEDGVVVEAGSVVGQRCRLGERTRLYARVVLYSDVRLGRDCIVHSGAVLGADGFGYFRTRDRHVKIPQVAGVEIGDDVEIGANTCIDRGTLSPTTVARNAKIDNLVQVAHNCKIGNRVILCGQVGLAGSTTVEDDAVLAGQVGVGGHLKIGRGAVVGAQAGIIHDVESGTRVSGFPALPIQEWRRVHAVQRTLPEMRSELRDLLRRVAEIEAKLAAAGGAA
jgi:UDP-3-O-[3-hydroxymyristoyl] glucosamine N-acyltransferase